MQLAGIPQRFEDLDQYIGVKIDGRWPCGICFAFKHQWKANVRNHIESKHFPGTFTHLCPLCGEACGSRQSLENHKRKHKEAQRNMDEIANK